MKTNMAPKAVKEYISARRQKKKWLIAVACLACAVVFCTIYALTLPAITLEAGKLAESAQASQDQTASNETEASERTSKSASATAASDEGSNSVTEASEKSSAAEESAEEEIQPLANDESSGVAAFRLWMWAWGSTENSTEKSYNMAAGYGEGSEITDVLQGQEDNSYLLPVSYFEEAYGSYGYSFDPEDTANCPITYAPSAYNAQDNLTPASYVQVDENWYVQIQDTTGLEPARSNVYYRNYKTVTDAVTPSSTVINMFDYWITNRDEPDNNDDTNHFFNGINGNHALKFRKDASANGNWNNWTGKAGLPYQGIVASTLQDGYPALSGNEDVFKPEPSTLGNVENDVNLKESLKYLFDPSYDGDSAAYRSVHRNVGGLLQVDKAGYYYYNSQENFAELDEKTNQVTLYEDWGVKHGGSSPDGQFFPFNKMPEVADLESIDSAINHYFGMTLTSRFVQRPGGYADSGHNVPTTFEFAGDDDVWIFIDNVLVADLGGIHDRTSVSIDFQSGNVTIANEGGTKTTSTTLKKAFEEAGMNTEDTDSWTDNTFADNTYHTLKFYYLERGNTDSNLDLKYNLTAIPSTGICKVDQYGEEVEGATFAVYAAEKDGNDDYHYLDTVNGKTVSLPVDYRFNLSENSDSYGDIVDSDGKTLVKALYTGTTNAAGQMIFLDEDKMPYTLKELEELFGTHFILREIQVPEGYRLVSDEIYLEIVNHKLLSCNNTYGSGVWASSNLLVTAPNTLQMVDNNNSKQPYYDFDNDTTNGTLFAVVLKYEGEANTGELSKQNNWKPVYGSDLDGYTVTQVDDNASGDDFINAVIKTAKAAKDYGDVEFQLGGSGMELNLTNLPGDINSYYYMLGDSEKENTKYTVAYYWSSETDWEKITVANTKRVDADQTTGIHSFSRSFGADINVPNINNRLLVQKLDEDGTLVNGAKFALYKVKEEDGKVYYVDEGGNNVSLGKDYDIAPNNGSITQDNTTIEPVEVETTAYNEFAGEQGTAIFTNLSEGTYYVREISAPDGYEINNTESMVLVTKDAIYANAGTADDGVKVARGPGYVVSTLAAFATEGDIDRTLTWIYTKLAVNTAQAGTFQFDLDDTTTNWELKKNGSNEVMLTYLKYSASDTNRLFNYSLNKDREADMNKKTVPAMVTQAGEDTRRLYTDEGWASLKIYQDSDYNDEEFLDGADYTDLTKYGPREGDIYNLFSRSTYIQVTDKRGGGDLEISKTVEKAPEKSNDTFTFTVKLTDSQDKALTGDYTYKVYQINGETGRTPVTDENGKAITGTLTEGTGKITLSDRQVAVIENLPAGTKYTITETADGAYGTTAREKVLTDAGEKSYKNYEFGIGEDRKVSGELYWKIEAQEDGTTKADTTSKVEFTNTGLPDLSIVKADTADPNKKLSGAKFSLYYEAQTDEGTCKTYYVTGGTTAGGWTTAESEAAELTSDSEGKITFSHIPDGTYYLIEKEAPPGYNLLSGPVVLTVAGGKVTIAQLATTDYAISEDGLTVTVTNSAGYELPNTGGNGTTLFTIGGLLLMAGAAGCGYSLRRRRERRDMN
ncbi:LPXTG cell wall anchor domain-containing protein [bacterium 210820-DFI.6.37]|nr:LPXTG cell wall anchor domain-containing protein [bacterium 210820-DFI.6.37]